MKQNPLLAGIAIVLLVLVAATVATFVCRELQSPYYTQQPVSRFWFYSAYNQGWYDARNHRSPSSYDPSYMRGYNDYCRRYQSYRPGYRFDLEIRH